MTDTKVAEYLTKAELDAMDARDGERERACWQAGAILRLVNGDFPNATLASILEAE